MARAVLMDGSPVADGPGGADVSVVLTEMRVQMVLMVLMALGWHWLR